MLRHAKRGHQHRFSFTVLQAWLGVACRARACRFIHRPLGIAILIVVVIRFVNRQFSTLPPFPASMFVPGALRRTRIRSTVVYPAVCAAARRLGDVVRSAISDCPVRVTASFSHPSAQRDAVREKPKWLSALAKLYRVGELAARAPCRRWAGRNLHPTTYQLSQHTFGA
jgi:hypothetical protein